MADVADEEQAAPGQLEGPPLRRDIGAVGLQLAGEAASVLGEGRLQLAAHESEPVGIGRSLVRGIDRGDRILEVDDGGERGFHHDVGQAGGIRLAHGMLPIEQQLDVQPMMPQQHGLWTSRITT